MERAPETGAVLETGAEPDAVVGRHVYGNLYGFEDPGVLLDEARLRRVLVEAARRANMTIADVMSMSRPDGVSVVVLVLESHLAIHTWAREGYVTLDVYTCGAKSDPWRAFDYIVKELRPRFYTVNYSDRSSSPPPSPGL